MCPDCSAEADRWLDSRPSRTVRPGLRIASGATYDDTARGVADRNAAVAADHRRLVRSQLGLISAHCRKAHSGHTGQDPR